MTRGDYEEGTNNEHHKAKLSHEVIAAAASYEAMKAYNAHREKNGETVSHGTTQEIMAAVGGALLDGLFESKGLDYIDKLKQKRENEE